MSECNHGIKEEQSCTRWKFEYWGEATSYSTMSETFLEFWNLFKVDEDSVPLTFVTYECQSFFVTYTMLSNLIKIKMKLPLKLDQLVFVVPIFSLQMLFQFFVLLWHNSAELPSSQCKLDLGAARKSVTSNVHFCAASSYFPHIFVEAYFCLWIWWRWWRWRWSELFLRSILSITPILKLKSGSTRNSPPFLSDGFLLFCWLHLSGIF